MNEHMLDAHLFGSWIIRARYVCGLTQNQLAAAIGQAPGLRSSYTGSEVARWESGSRQCHNKRADRVIRAVRELLRQRQEAVALHLKGVSDEIAALQAQAPYFSAGAGLAVDSVPPDEEKP